jgi:hypothetical protein
MEREYVEVTLAVHHPTLQLGREREKKNKQAIKQRTLL